MSESETADRILDAVVALTIETGMRKVSVDDIARRAGLSRATVYLQFPQRNRLLEAAIERELGELLRKITEVAEQYEDPEERLIGAVAGALQLAIAHPAITALLRLNPAPLIPYVLGEHALGISIGRAFASSLIGDDLLSGEARAQFAEHIIRQFHSLLIAPSSTIPLATEDECRRYVRTFLLPVYWGLRQT